MLGWDNNISRKLPMQEIIWFTRNYCQAHILAHHSVNRTTQTSLMQWWSQSSRLVCPLLSFLQSTFLHLFEQLVLQGEQLSRSLINGILLPHAWVPPAVQPLPEAYVSHADDRFQHCLDGHIAAAVQRITILFVGWIYKRPQRDGAIFQICVGETEQVGEIRTD